MINEINYINMCNILMYVCNKKDINGQSCVKTNSTNQMDGRMKSEIQSAVIVTPTFPTDRHGPADR